MAMIDIRNSSCVFVDKIQFAPAYGPRNATYISLINNRIVFEDSDEDASSYSARCSDIDNLIKALQKAKELGWDKL